MAVVFKKQKPRDSAILVMSRSVRVTLTPASLNPQSSQHANHGHGSAKYLSRGSTLMFIIWKMMSVLSFLRIFRLVYLYLL